MVAQDGVMVESRDWAAAKTPSEAMNLVTQYYGDVVESAELPGNEFVEIKKDGLVGQEFLILEFGFQLSDKIKNSDGEATEYAWVRAIRDNGQRVYFADGSSGIYKQLRTFYDKTDRDGGMMCRRGLRKSVYEVETSDGRQEATTYYIA